MHAAAAAAAAAVTAAAERARLAYTTVPTAGLARVRDAEVLVTLQHGPEL